MLGPQVVALFREVLDTKRWDLSGGSGSLGASLCLFVSCLP
jgi:hypothetical protein